MAFRIIVGSTSDCYKTLSLLHQKFTAVMGRFKDYISAPKRNGYQCYPTSIQIPLIPLIRKKMIDIKNITIDSKSGYSGAGKNLKYKFKLEHKKWMSMLKMVSQHIGCIRTEPLIKKGLSING